MYKRISCLLALACAAPVWADSLTLGAVADNNDGRSISLSGRYAPLQTLTLGANIGHSRAMPEDGGETLSGNSLGIGADLSLGGFIAYAAADRWKDSNALRSTVLRGELGWMSTTGITFSGLVVDRDMRVTYTTTVLGQARERNIDFEGTGFGADFSYFGASWTAGVRLLDYDYGRSVDRVRAVIDSGNTAQFPRLEQLIGSVTTRAASTPDRELSLMAGRQFAKTSLTAALQWQRDALTGEKVKGADLTLGLRPSSHLGVDVSVGASRAEAGTTVWAGFALTLRSAKQEP